MNDTPQPPSERGLGVTERQPVEHLVELTEELGPDLVELAAHASVAVALSPELVHLLRINFFLDPPARLLPYPTEWRLLLSPLCREIGDGLYEIEPDLRNGLLQRLVAGHGRQRLRDVATLLWQYCERSPWPDYPELERAQQLAALSCLDPYEARAWLNKEEPAEEDSVERRWFVAMEQEVETLEAAASTAAGLPQVDPGRLVAALARLDFAPQIRAFAMNFVTANVVDQGFIGFLISGPPGHGQRWLLHRLLAPGFLAAAGRPSAASDMEIIELALDARIEREGAAGFATELAARLGIEQPPSPWSAAAQPLLIRLQSRDVTLVIDGLDRVDARFVQGLAGDLGTVGTALKDASKTAASPRFYLFLLDHSGRAGAPDGPFPDHLHVRMFPHIVRLPPIERFNRDELLRWLSESASDLPPELVSSPAAGADAILENSDDGVPERALQYICWRSGVAWERVVEATRPVSRAGTDRAAAAANEATLGALAREFDEIRQTMSRSEQRNDAMQGIVHRMRAAAAVDVTVISTLAKSQSVGDRLAAIVALQERPDGQFLSWLASRLRPGEYPYADPDAGEPPFVGLQAALALERAARRLSVFGEVGPTLALAAKYLGSGLARSDRREALDWAEMALLERSGPRQSYSALAQEYDQLRRFEPVSDERTEKMTRIVDRLQRLPEPSAALMRELMSSPSAGMRLQAIASLARRPDPEHLTWLAERLGREKWFVGYHAAVALLRAADVLDADHFKELRDALERARKQQRESGDPNQAFVLKGAKEKLAERQRVHSEDAPAVSRTESPLPEPRTLRPASGRSEPARGSGIWKLWANGSTLGVKFLDGDAVVHGRVAAVAKEWTEYANLHFRFLGPEAAEQAEIRVSFAQPGWWSYVGTDALMIDQGEPTMNYGEPTPDSGPALLSRAALHNFGLALGLVHEHQNPNARIPWNKEVVYREMFGPPNHWDKSTVDQNVFRTHPRSQLPWYREFDPDSIMMYSFPASWMLHGVTMGGKNVLSASDKAFIAQLYPREAQAEPMRTVKKRAAGRGPRARATTSSRTTPRKKAAPSRRASRKKGGMKKR